MATFRAPPRKGENYELSADLNSEYREKRKDAIKRVIANMTVQKGAFENHNASIMAEQVTQMSAVCSLTS